MIRIPAGSRETILLIGIGNEFRSDDGLGIHVVRELRHHLRPAVRVIEECGEGTSLITSWTEATHVFIVDAIISGKNAGTLHRIDALREQVPRGFFNSSSHSFGVAEALELAKRLHELPETMILYGIEAESFEYGIGLSSSVVRTIPDLLHAIKNDITALSCLQEH